MTWLAGVLLIALALLGISLPWWSPRFVARRGLARKAANVALYRERLAQLPNEVAAGTLNAASADEMKTELAARLLADADEQSANEVAQPSRGLLVGALLALSAFGVAWYVLAGTWRTQGLIELSHTNPEAARLIAEDRMLGELEAHVKAHPDDAESWVWLGRGYRDRSRNSEAAHAYEEASRAKGGQDPDILTEWGEALAYAQDRSLAGAPAEKFEQALALAPDHPRALWYAGAAALHTGDSKTALARWERLLHQDMPDKLRSALLEQVNQLRKASGQPPLQVAAAPANALTLKVTVKLTPAMKKRVYAGETLFVYAQDPAGPPMPLAVKVMSPTPMPRVPVELTDDDSPMPTRKLSSVGRWRVVARISSSGGATPQSGDLEGSVEIGRAEAGKPVVVTIDHARP